MSPTQLSSPTRPECILVVDDSPDTVRHLAEILLPMHGYQTISALDGHSALEIIRREKPDLVILDLNLPRMTGLDVLGALALDEHQPPVILMTGYGSEKNAVEAFRLGARDYLIKPFTLDEVLGAVQRALAARAQTQGSATHQLTAAQMEAQRQTRRLQTLHAISQAFNALYDVSQIADRLLRLSLGNIEGDSAILWLQIPDQPPQAYIYCSRRGRVQLLQPMLQNAAVEQVLSTRQAVRQSAFSQSVDIGAGITARALLYAPLLAGNQVWGVLGLHNQYAPRSFSQQDEEYLNLIAAFAGAALQHAFAADDLQLRLGQREQEMASLARLLQALADNAPVGPTLRAALIHVFNQWRIEVCALWLAEEPGQSAQLLEWVGEAGSAESLPDVHLVDHVIAARQWAFTNEAITPTPPSRSSEQRPGSTIRSILCVPLVHRARALGALELINKLDGDFTPQDVERALTSSAILTLALHTLKPTTTNPAPTTPRPKSITA